MQWQNTKKSSEISAIDYVVTSHQVLSWINKMVIDEESLMKIKGKNESDHNTFHLEITIDLNFMVSCFLTVRHDVLLLRFGNKVSRVLVMHCMHYFYKK